MRLLPLLLHLQVLGWALWKGAYKQEEERKAEIAKRRANMYGGYGYGGYNNNNNNRGAGGNSTGNSGWW